VCRKIAGHCGFEKKERRKIPCKNDEMKIRNMDSVFFSSFFSPLITGNNGKIYDPYADQFDCQIYRDFA
jgi:hypothetical protein